MNLLLVISVIAFLFLSDFIIKAFRIKTKTVFILIAILASVTLYKIVLKERFIDKDLTAAFNSEMTYIQENCSKEVSLPKKYVVEFGKTGDAIGYCQKYLNGFKIVINTWYWNHYLDTLGRHQLLLHEMMHCVFNVKHKSDPSHFMAPEYDYIKPGELDRQVKELLKEVCS